MYIPESVFKPTDLMQNPTSRVSEFSEDCTKDDFYIKPSAQGFCRDSTFSLTTAFNNGTLPCNCDAKGSIDESCGELGGQCKCKSQHITGRTCNRCRMGYYGFPNCRGMQFFMCIIDGVHFCTRKLAFHNQVPRFYFTFKVKLQDV